jgi:hypothetical protein
MSHTAVYNTQRWRDLPREYCLASELLGEAVGQCRGTIHRHHVNPDDPDSRTVELCAAHHSRVHAVLRSLTREPMVRRCPHRHVTPEARAACERRLNSA